MTIQSTSFAHLVIALVIISLFQIGGAVAAYVLLPNLKGRERTFSLFSGYLMIVLSVSLMAVHIMEEPLTRVHFSGLFSGFALGAGVAFAIMWLHHRISHRHSHWTIALVILLMLTVHEIAEAMSVSELFFEAPQNTPLQFALVPLVILALHEFPEGTLLVLPFFISRRIKTGLLAVVFNQIIFIAAGILFYLFFFIRVEPSLAQEVFLETIPAGGIFYLGMDELLKHLPRHETHHR